MLGKKTVRQIVTGALLVAAGALPAFGAIPEGGGGGHREGVEAHRNQFLARMAEVLGLNDGQKAKIKAILEAEREKKNAYVAEIRETRKKLHEALRAPEVNEPEVRALAAKKGQIQTELAVSAARTRNAVREILTPEQRALADKLRPLLAEARKEHGPGGRFGGRFPDHRFGSGPKEKGCGCMDGKGHHGDRHEAGMLAPEAGATAPAE